MKFQCLCVTTFKVISTGRHTPLHRAFQASKYPSEVVLEGQAVPSRSRRYYFSKLRWVFFGQHVVTYQNTCAAPRTSSSLIVGCQTLAAKTISVPFSLIRYRGRRKLLSSGYSMVSSSLSTGIYSVASRNRVIFRDICLRHYSQTGSGAHGALYARGNSCFLGCRLPETWNWQPTCILRCAYECVELYLLFHIRCHCVMHN